MSIIQKQTGFLKFTHETSTARLTIWDNNVGHITGVYSRVRGQGYASQLLTSIIQYADENYLKLILEVESYGKDDLQKLNNDQLVGFYSKFGFEIVPDGGSPLLMDRRPQKQLP